LKPFEHTFKEQFAAMRAELEMPKPCPEHGTPDIRRVGNRVTLACKCRSVTAGSGREAVELWNEQEIL
jgi:hypothetical protein